MNEIYKSVKRLQKSIGAKDDGAWGDESQSKLIETKMRVDIDETVLNENLKALGRAPTKTALKGFSNIIDAANKFSSETKNPLYLAYMLATAWHETAHTMKPIEEYGKGRGRPYGRNIDIHGGAYTGLPHKYYGRGYVQLTWLTNYVNMGRLLNVDFVNNPEKTLEPEHAANIMFEGMLRGTFTGKKLSSCIRYGGFNEFVYARRIINGTDKATLIAGYAQAILDAIVFKPVFVTE